MINKQKTIEKAIAKFKELYPIRGKKSLSDCFFYIHGEILFVFRTKDKKIRTIKAVKIQPIIQPVSRGSILIAIYQTLTKPISISALIGKLKEQVAI